MKIAWKKLLVTGVLGFAGGKTCSRLKEHPEIVLPILQASAASGLLGAAVGAGVSSYRHLPSHIYSLSLGVNFAVVTGVFLGIRHGIQTSLIPSQQQSRLQVGSNYSPNERGYLSSTLSGGITGAATSLISWYGLRSILLTSLGGMGVGLCGQMGYERFLKWRKKKAMEIHHPELFQQRGEGMSFARFERWFLGFWHQRSKSVQVEMEITAMESAIAEERKKIAQLCRRLGEELIDEEEEELDKNELGEKQLYD